jgi:hypothetical protein
VPVDPTKVDDFDPAAVPTVGQLLRELDRPVPDGNENVDMADGENGSPRSKAAPGMFGLTYPGSDDI